MGKRLWKIVTRTGDDGSTGLGDGTRVRKDAVRVEAYGTVDECNSTVGVIGAVPGLPPAVQAVLLEVQHDLFDLGGELCIPGHRVIEDAHVERIEGAIEDFNATLKPLAEFILPGGGPAAAACHVARAVARRAERRTWTLAQTEPVAPQVHVGVSSRELAADPLPGRTTAGELAEYALGVDVALPGHVGAAEPVLEILVGLLVDEDAVFRALFVGSDGGEALAVDNGLIGGESLRFRGLGGLTGRGVASGGVASGFFGGGFLGGVGFVARGALGVAFGPLLLLEGGFLGRHPGLALLAGHLGLGLRLFLLRELLVFRLDLRGATLRSVGLGVAA